MVNRGVGTGPGGHCLVKDTWARMGSCVVNERSQGWALYGDIYEQTDIHN